MGCYCYKTKEHEAGSFDITGKIINYNTARKNKKFDVPSLHPCLFKLARDTKQKIPRTIHKFRS
jgi:hypothetical protein